MLEKSNLRLGSSHDFETNEQLRNDCSSYEGRWLKISSSNSSGRSRKIHPVEWGDGLVVVLLDGSTRRRPKRRKL